jgi:hypothetical protein
MREITVSSGFFTNRIAVIPSRICLAILIFRQDVFHLHTYIVTGTLPKCPASQGHSRKSCFKVPMYMGGYSVFDYDFTLHPLQLPRTFLLA